MRLVPLIFGCALPLVGCGAGDLTPAQTDVGRNFDALASAVTGCADALHECGDADDAGRSENAKCRDAFLECRAHAGKSAETELAEAIGTCKEQHASCESDAGVKDCARTLRGCIGEVRAQAQESSDAALPNAHPPTYQCFGQLRECVASASEPRECAAEARACVISAVGDPPEARHPSGVQPSAAGSGGKGEAGKGEAGKGEAGKGEAGKGEAGKGEAGRAEAGKGGAGGSRSVAGAGTGGSMQPPAETAECMAQRDACLMSGEEPKKCARELRMCGKPKP